jgi:hypothetical protein
MQIVLLLLPAVPELLCVLLPSPHQSLEVD